MRLIREWPSRRCRWIWAGCLSVTALWWVPADAGESFDLTVSELELIAATHAPVVLIVFLADWISRALPGVLANTDCDSERRPTVRRYVADPLAAANPPAHPAIITHRDIPENRSRL